MQEMRSLVFELRPADLESEGLVATLEKHVDVLQRVHGADIALEVAGDRRLDPRVEKELFRIVQEAIGNALKHAGASSIRVRVQVDGRALLSVTDDGAGFDAVAAPARTRRLGLTSMRERAEALGGTLAVHSRPGAGTTVSVEVDVGTRHQSPRR